MSNLTETGVIDSAKDFKPESPAKLQRKWQLEVNSALKARKKWISQAEKAAKRYLGERAENETADTKTRVNLFHSNINIVRSILFGQIPKVDVSKRYHDPNDEEARVASEALERHLNTDIEMGSEDFEAELKDAIWDWKVPGMGQIRLRYDVSFKTVSGLPAQLGANGSERAPGVPEHERKAKEDIVTDYVHWRDFIWSPCRRWKEVRWVAFRAEMTKDQANKRFAAAIKKAGPLPVIDRKWTEDGESNKEMKDAWNRVVIWEIWNKEDRKIYWYCDGYPIVLDSKDDILGLRSFFPCPRPMMSNAITSQLMPKPDLEIDRHLYDEIDDIADRLRKLLKACRVTGGYDAAFPELGRILEEAREGQLIGVRNWSAFTEKGGLQNAVQLVPIEGIVKAIEVLTAKLVEKIALLDQVIGLSDIIRGQQQNAQETATTSRLKAGFASTRLQTDQDEVARFTSDLQRLRAELISKHFDAATIIDRSNLLRAEIDPNTQQPNIPLIEAGVQLIKSNIWDFRIQVKADSIAMRDYASLKQERVETIQTLAGLFQQAVPMVQIFPQAAPFLLQIGKWLIAATKGSQQIEGQFDRLVTQIEMELQKPKPPQQDPQLEVAKVKAGAEAQKAQMGVVQSVVDAKTHAAKAQVDMQKTQFDMQKGVAQHRLDLEKMAAAAQAEAMKPPPTAKPAKGAQ